jgi:hypothetical protein
MTRRLCDAAPVRTSNRVTPGCALRYREAWSSTVALSRAVPERARSVRPRAREMARRTRPVRPSRPTARVIAVLLVVCRYLPSQSRWWSAHSFIELAVARLPRSSGWSARALSLRCLGRNDRVYGSPLARHECSEQNVDVPYANLGAGILRDQSDGSPAQSAAEVYAPASMREPSMAIDLHKPRSVGKPADNDRPRTTRARPIHVARNAKPECLVRAHMI